VSSTTPLPPVHPSRLQINKHIEQKLHLLPAKRCDSEKDDFESPPMKYSNNVPSKIIKIENPEEEKLHDFDNSNIENYKYFSQIQTLKKRSIQPQIRYDQIMTNNETSMNGFQEDSLPPSDDGVDLEDKDNYILDFRLVSYNITPPKTTYIGHL